jgi:hypothetical protein
LQDALHGHASGGGTAQIVHGLFAVGSEARHMPALPAASVQGWPHAAAVAGHAVGDTGTQSVHAAFVGAEARHVPTLPAASAQIVPHSVHAAGAAATQVVHGMLAAASEPPQVPLLPAASVQVCPHAVHGVGSISLLAGAHTSRASSSSIGRLPN